MRSCSIALLILLTGCSQFCRCEKEQVVHQDAAAQQTASSSADTQLDDKPPADPNEFYVKPMRSAGEAEYVPHAPSQLDQVAQDPNAKPFLAVTPSYGGKPIAKRTLLPSELAAAQQGLLPALSPETQLPMSAYPQLPHSKVQLTDYAAQLVFKLANFGELKGAKVGVTSFVEFDQTLEQSNALGNQFAEALATVLPQYGVDVIEYKLTRGIYIRPDGDFALSRDVKKLHNEVGMDYVLTGTLVTTRRGVQINSRVVSVSQQKVIAAATTLLPHQVLQQIQP